MKHFSHYPSFVSGQGVISENGGASGGIGIPFPAPGIPQRDEESSGSSPNAPASAFAGNGVVVGSSQPSPNQGARTNTYTVQQNIREVPAASPSAPNSETQKSKIVQEHNAKVSQAEEHKKEEEVHSSEATNSDNEDEAEDDMKEGSQESQNSKNSKNEDDVLIDLS